MARAVLGIDLGSTSVKVSIVYIDNGNFEVKCRGKSTYDQPSRIWFNRKFSQQNVKVIFDSFDTALSQCNQQSLTSLQLITICGQMHGCVLWNHQSLFEGHRINFEAISDLYDWTDQRCDKEFLQTLPTPQSYADQIATGYGCATLFWLQKHQPNYLKRFNKAGTIMDLFATILCKNNQVMISGHNAHSWGYFDPETNRWNLELLEQAGFPTGLLPKPVPLNTTIGFSRSTIPGIPIEIPVLIPYGDLQSVMYPVFRQYPDSLVINMGTSAQVCQQKDNQFRPEKKSLSSIQSIDYFPFVSGQYLAVAASLNGGNVLRSLVDFFLETTKNLTGIELSEEAFWTKINELEQLNQEEEEEEEEVQIVPRLFGERHEPDSCFTMANIRTQVPNLMQLIRELFRSLVENILDMMSVKHGLADIVCTGSVFAHQGLGRKIMQQIVAKRYGCSVIFVANFDADVGCALFGVNQLKSN